MLFINRLFVAEVKRQLVLRKWTSKDLANSFVVSEMVKFAAKKAVINYNDD